MGCLFCWAELKRLLAHEAQLRGYEGFCNLAAQLLRENKSYTRIAT